MISFSFLWDRLPAQAGLMARLAETSSARRGGQDIKVFFVYILKSLNDKKSYVGVTNNLERRLNEHNSGKHFYTKRHLPWIIIYKEKFNDFTNAITREKFLKTTSGRRFLKKIFDNQ